MQCRPRGSRSSLGSKSSMPQRADQVAVLGMAEAAGEDADLRGTQVQEDGAQQDRAAERVGIAHPLGEDVGAPATDGLALRLRPM